MLSEERISSGSYLSQSHAEKLVAAVGREVPFKHLTLDLSSCESVQLGAGWRLGNALRRYGRNEALEVVVPSPPENFTGLWFLNFTRSGLGYALAKYAARIRTSEGSDISADVRDYYELQVSEISQNHIMYVGFDRMRDVVSTEENFKNDMTTWLSKLRAPMGTFNTQDEAALRSLFFEALENVPDHAKGKPLDRDIEILAMFSLRYYGVKEPAVTDHLQGPLGVYIARIRRQRVAHRELLGFIELVISDDGVGIAARHSLDSEVYWDNPERERDVLFKALGSGATVKLIADDAPIRGDPGYGYTYILDALQSLGAWATLRTGRLRVDFDGTDKDPLVTSYRTKLLGYLPGTVLTTIVPVFSAQLDFLT